MSQCVWKQFDPLLENNSKTLITWAYNRTALL